MSARVDNKGEQEGMREEQDHQERHRQVERLIAETIQDFRERVGVDSIWTITVTLDCAREDSPAETTTTDRRSSHGGIPAASITWDRDMWRARLSIRCDLPEEQLRRETLHELIELAWHGTGELWYFALCKAFMLRYDMDPELRHYLHEEYRVRRNQEVEKVVRLVLAGSQHAPVLPPIDIVLSSSPSSPPPTKKKTKKEGSS